MADRVAVGECALERGSIGQVGGLVRKSRAAGDVGVRRSNVDGLDVVAAIEQGVGDVTGKKSSRAGYGDSQSAISSMVFMRAERTAARVAAVAQ